MLAQIFVLGVYPIICVESGSLSPLYMTWSRQSDHLHFFLLTVETIIIFAH